MWSTRPSDRALVLGVSRMMQLDEPRAARRIQRVYRSRREGYFEAPPRGGGRGAGSAPGSVKRDGASAGAAGGRARRGGAGPAAAQDAARPPPGPDATKSARIRENAQSAGTELSEERSA